MELTAGEHKASISNVQLVNNFCKKADKFVQALKEGSDPRQVLKGKPIGLTLMVESIAVKLAPAQLLQQCPERDVAMLSRNGSAVGLSQSRARPGRGFITFKPAARPPRQPLFRPLRLL